jgi:hypothetical protein
LVILRRDDRQPVRVQRSGMRSLPRYRPMITVIVIYDPGISPKKFDPEIEYPLRGSNSS